MMWHADTLSKNALTGESGLHTIPHHRSTPRLGFPVSRVTQITKPDDNEPQ